MAKLILKYGASSKYFQKLADIPLNSAHILSMKIPSSENEINEATHAAMHGATRRQLVLSSD